MGGWSHIEGLALHKFFSLIYLLKIKLSGLLIF